MIEKQPTTSTNAVVQLIELKQQTAAAKAVFLMILCCAKLSVANITARENY